MLREKNDIKSSKIIGIQFSILTPDEIRKASVAEITHEIHILIINQLLVVYLTQNGCFRTRINMSYRWSKLYGNSWLFWSY